MQQSENDVRIGIIGGTGLGDMLLTGMAPDDMQEHRNDTPFGAPSCAIVTGTYAGTPIAFLKRHGEGHVCNPAQVPYRANVYALKALGCTHVLASGATGSLREDIAPGDVVLCDQLIDRTDGRPRTFFDHAAVHVEFADPMCPVMRRWLIEAADGIDDTRVHHAGTYICMEGPSFSTRAESEMHRSWGADVVGMTALPEARLIREAEMAYALIALPTDYDCWKTRDHDTPAESLLQEIIGNLQAATAASIRLIEAALRDVSVLQAQASPAHEALALAIWSDKAQIEKDEVQRLDVLWGRHFTT
jgi:5'-methylthioadenosine phosphorylase